MNVKNYPPNWKAFSAEIRARAGQRCEKCCAPNLTHVVRFPGAYMLDDGRAFSDENGYPLGTLRLDEMAEEGWMVRIVLTVAHLNAPGGVCKCEPRCAIASHVLALCQRCHLRYDHARHVKNARATRFNRKAARDLFAFEPTPSISTKKGDQ